MKENSRRLKNTKEKNKESDKHESLLNFIIRYA